MISWDEAIKIIADYEINGCGYCHEGGEEVEEAFAMAIEALKAQEPRVMTLEELKAEKVFRAFEWRTCGFETTGIYKGSYDNGEELIAILAVTAFTEDLENKESEYSVTWRCWTARPDEETRRTTPWE